MGVVRRDDDEERQTFLSTSRASKDTSFARENLVRSTSWYLRWGIEVAMAVTIAILLFRPVTEPRTRPSKPAPVPSFSRKPVVFRPNSRYLHENMFVSKQDTRHTLHNWIELSAVGRGYIAVNDGQSFNLSMPYMVPVNRTEMGPGYMMSVFHQLHCLSYIVEHFQAGYGGVVLEQEVAHHSAHCFDYLRQSIMCAGDTSLEGNTTAGPGWGSEHQCIDYEALLLWANKNGADGWRGNLPDEATL